MEIVKQCFNFALRLAPILTLVACATLSPSTPVSLSTCADLDATWGNWPATIDTLNDLIASNQTCGDEPLSSKLYAAHINYGASLEQAGDNVGAASEYSAALTLNPRRDEALEALYRLNALPASTASPCAPPNLAFMPTPTPVYQPGNLVNLQGNQLMWEGQPFHIRGVNYYPRYAPWDRFLAQGDINDMRTEINLIAGSGFNTIRVFLSHNEMFQCKDGRTNANADAFVKVDFLMALARDNGLKVIVTLNDLPDLYIAPLYTTDTPNDALTAYIIKRYAADPALLAWDIRNEPDLDYTPRTGKPTLFTQDQVIGWLGREAAIVRANDPNHLITAGWFGNPMVSEPYVDFLSFHHWTDATELSARIDEIRAASGKPILLEETGYSSWTVGEQASGDSLRQVTEMAEAKGLAGWMIWAAFDFQPSPGQVETAEHHFGLWTLDLTRKPALEALPLP